MNMKHFLILVLFLNPIVIMAQTFDSSDSLKKAIYYFPNQTVSGEGYLLNKTPHGFWKNYYESGKIKSKGKLILAKTDSTWLFFNENGFLSMRIDYSFGKKNGVRELYSDSGIIKSKEFFVQDIKNGWTELFNDRGILLAQIFYIEDKEENFAAEFEEDGRIVNILEYRKGSLLKKNRVNRYDKQKQKTGLWVETDSLYRIQKSIQYLNNMKNGFLKEYDSNGNLVKLEKYINDILQAEEKELNKVKLQKSFFENGNVKSQGSFIEGTPVGIHTYYDSLGNAENARYYLSGFLVSEGRVDNQGRKQGEWKEYFSNGNVKSVGSYLDDLKTGSWKYFFSEGQKEQTGDYLKGLPTGRWNWFYEDGKLLRDEYFKLGKEEGYSYELLSGGDTLSAGEYDRGQREGKWFFRQGDQKITGEFVAGEMNGLWVHYYDTGQKSFEGEFRESLAVGLHKSWHHNGELKWKGNFIAGVRDGVWNKYSSDGVLEFSITYENGLEKKYFGTKVFPEFFPADFESLIEKNPYVF